MVDGDGKELVDVVEDTPQPEVEDSRFEFELDDGSSPDTEIPDPLELAKRVAELEEEKKQIEARADSTSGLTAAFAQLAEKLEKGNKPTPNSSPTSTPLGTQEPQIDWNALRETVNKENFQSPFDATIKSVAPLFNQFEKKFSDKFAEVEKKNKLVDSKLKLTTDPTLSGIYGKYGSEVEEAVMSGSDYVEAAQRVQLAHLSDIVAEEAAKLVAKAQEEMAKPTSSPQFTNSGAAGSAVNKAKVGKKGRVTPSQLAVMQQYALNWAMNPNDEDDMNYVYAALKTDGKL